MKAGDIVRHKSYMVGEWDELSSRLGIVKYVFDDGSYVDVQWFNHLKHSDINTIWCRRLDVLPEDEVALLSLAGKIPTWVLELGN